MANARMRNKSAIFGSTRLKVEQTPRGERALYIGQRFHAATKVLMVAQEQTKRKSEFRSDAGKPKLSILALQTMLGKSFRSAFMQ